MNDTGFYIDVFVFSEKVQIFILCIFGIIVILLWRFFVWIKGNPEIPFRMFMSPS